MGLFDKLSSAAGYGGDLVCKYCKQKKTVMSSYACSPGRKHKWVDPDEIENERDKEVEQKQKSSGLGGWLWKQATKKYKG